jgi:hypothetical protein
MPLAREGDACGSSEPLTRPYGSAGSGSSVTAARGFGRSAGCAVLPAERGLAGAAAVSLGEAGGAVRLE